MYVTVCDRHHRSTISAPGTIDLMDSYKVVVVEYLRADSAMFVNTDCCIQGYNGKDVEPSGFRWSCDAIAVDFRHRAVYLCEIAFTQGLHALIKRLGVWTKNQEEIKNGLQHVCKLPSHWRVYVWLFVPRDSFEMLDAKLEELRSTFGSSFKVRITALEDVQPWRSSAWDRNSSQLPEPLPPPIGI